MKKLNLTVWVSVCLLTFISCNKEDLEVENQAKLSINRVSVLSDKIVDSIVYANVKYDSLWYIDLSKEEMLVLGVPEERYDALVENLKEINVALCESYKKGMTVIFPKTQQFVTKRSVEDEDPEWYGTAVITGYENNSTSIYFRTRNSMMAFTINGYTDYLALEINGVQFTGWNGARFSIQNMYDKDSSGYYNWSLNIRSIFPVISPHTIRVTFFNINV